MSVEDKKCKNCDWRCDNRICIMKSAELSANCVVNDDDFCIHFSNELSEVKCDSENYTLKAQ